MCSPSWQPGGANSVRRMLSALMIEQVILLRWPFGPRITEFRAGDHESGDLNGRQVQLRLAETVLSVETSYLSAHGVIPSIDAGMCCKPNQVTAIARDRRSF